MLKLLYKNRFSSFKTSLKPKNMGVFMKKMSKKALLNNYPGFGYMDDITEITSQYFKGMDLNCFGHSSVWPEGKYSFLFTNHDWPRERIFNDIPPPGITIYEKITDKVIFPAIDKVNGLDWSEDIISLAKERFNIHNPMIITRKYEDHYEVFSFSLNCESAYEKYINNFDLFEKFIHYYKDKSRKMIERTNKYCLLIDNKFLPVNKKLMKCSLNTANGFPSNIIKKYYLRHNNCNIILSSKEYDCLSALSHGMQIKSIAKELGISVRTVETYFTRIKNKLNLCNRDELAKVYWNNRILSG